MVMLGILSYRHTIHKLPSGDKLMAMTDVRVKPSKKGGKYAHEI